MKVSVKSLNLLCKLTNHRSCSDSIHVYLISMGFLVVNYRCESRLAVLRCGLSSSQNIIRKTKRSRICHTRTYWCYSHKCIRVVYGSIRLFEKKYRCLRQFFTDFSEELSRENEMELFAMRIIFKL